MKPEYYILLLPFAIFVGSAELMARFIRARIRRPTPKYKIGPIIAWATMVASHSIMVYSIWVAFLYSNFKVIHDFNYYGEGVLELVLSTIASVFVFRELKAMRKRLR